VRPIPPDQRAGEIAERADCREDKKALAAGGERRTEQGRVLTPRSSPLAFSSAQQYGADTEREASDAVCRRCDRTRARLNTV
jgi:hypothetical protein